MAETRTQAYTQKSPIKGVGSAARFLTMAALLALTPLASFAKDDDHKQRKSAKKTEKLSHADKKKSQHNLDSVSLHDPEYRAWLEELAHQRAVADLAYVDTLMDVTLASPLPGKKWSELGLG